MMFWSAKCGFAAASPTWNGRCGLPWDPQKDIDNSKNDKIRLFTVPKLKANEPVTDVTASWVECGPTTLSNFSAVAYYFGRDLQKSMKVPVGLIHTSWGGSPAEGWMRQGVLEGNGQYKAEIVDEYTAQMDKAKNDIAKWEAERDEAQKAGKPFNRGRPGPFWKPAELYNGMIAPLIPYALAGAIWYQGESNAGRAHQYRMLFADMISNWRADFGQGDFPFLLVQLAPWDKGKKRDLSEITKEPGESDWAELREAQLLSTKILPNVGMAVITDLGDKDDIHPKQKEPVGHRLALAAEGIAYDKRITYSGPIYRELEIEGDKAIVSFDHVGRGLEAKGGELKGFAIAGADRKFVWAKRRSKATRL